MTKLSLPACFRLFTFPVLALALAPTVALRADDTPKRKKPNILYIMSDDHAAQAIGAYGGRLAALNPTPTIDRLAREGMLFENVFAGNAICVPSRATILTGQYAHAHGVVDLGGGIVPSEQHLAIEMKKAGYETAMIGKWHLKHEPAAFDHYCVLPGQGKYHDPEFRVRGPKGWPRDLVTFEGKHSTDVITDLSLEWLFAERDQEKPFFLMHHYKAPHDYFEHAARYDDWLADTEIPQPVSLLPEHRSRSGSIATLGYEGELIPHIGTSIGKRNPRRSYAVDLPGMFPKDFPPGYDPADLSEAEIQRLSYNAYQTPPGWELYDLESDPREDVNLYDDPARAPLVAELKQRLADLRTRVGDTGEHFPKAEAVVREFWDYDGTDRARAVEISAEFLRIREAELSEAEKRKGK